MASYFNRILEQPQRHIPITANLQYLEVEFEKLLQALNQIDDLFQVHFGPMQFDLKEVNF